MSSFLNANHVEMVDNILLPSEINKTRGRTYSDSSVEQSNTSSTNRLKELKNKTDNKPKSNANNVETESPKLVKKKKRRKEDDRSDFKNRRKKLISEDDNVIIKKYINEKQRLPYVLVHRIDFKEKVTEKKEYTPKDDGQKFNDSSSKNAFSSKRKEKFTNNLVSKETSKDSEKNTERSSLEQEEIKSSVKSAKEMKRKRGRPRKDSCSRLPSTEQDDPSSNGQESGYVSTHMTESFDSDDSIPIKMTLKKSRKRALSISSSSESEASCKKESNFRADKLKSCDLNLLKLSNKKLVVRLTKLNIVPNNTNNCTENLMNNIETKNSTIYSTKTDKNEIKDDDKLSKRQPTKIVIKPKVNKKEISLVDKNDTIHNNNIDNQNNAVSSNPKSQSSILRKVRIQNRSNKNSQTDKSINEIGTKSFSMTNESFAAQKVVDNEKNVLETVANVVTPRRITVDKREADETQKAKLQMLMNATTPRDDENEEIQKTAEDKFICSMCTKVLDIISRLEPLFGMTEEEDDSAIKCPLCPNSFQSLFHLDHHVSTRHYKCENEKKCRHSRDNTYNIPKPEMTMESEIYVKIQLKCKYCHELFDSVLLLNEHVKIKHSELLDKKSIKLNGSSKRFQYHNQAVNNCDLLNCDLLSSNKNEKLNFAAYEVFTCTLCKSTFVMKDEVFDHLLKVHEVSCKYPCFSCLTNFQTLKVQESHKCQEVKLNNLDKLISVAIELPLQKNNHSDNNQRDFKLTDETEEALNMSTEASDTKMIEPLNNGLKRKINGRLTSHMIEFHHVSPKKATELIAISNQLNYSNNNKDESINEEIDYWEKLSDIDQKNVDKDSIRNCCKCNSEIVKISEIYIQDSPNKFKSLFCKDCNITNENTFSRKIEHECNKCLKSFQSIKELREHKKSQHVKGEKPFTCEICKKLFSNRSVLERHKSIKHKNLEEKKVNENQCDENVDKRSLRVKSTKVVDKISVETPTITLSTTTEKRGKKGKDQKIDSSPEGIICPICNNNFSSIVVLKNHLKHEHQRRASICQFCNDLLIDTSAVRHMLDHHIVPSNKSKCQKQLNKQFSNENTMKKDVEELVRILGKERLQALIIYHDFEGKSNNEMMKCPGCSQTFCNSRACRQHYLDYHDKMCLLCDESFLAGVNACKHRVEAHNSTATYIWSIQSLVTAIANVMKIPEGTPSSNLLLALRKRFDGEVIFNKNEKIISEDSQAMMLLHCASDTTQEEFLEEVLSEDQLPDPGIEVVIGKDESEDDLLTMLNLSPNYQSISHHESRLSITDVTVPPQVDFENKIREEALIETSENISASLPAEVTTSTAGPEENYVPSGVYKYKLDDLSEEFVLIVTEEDATTYKNDIESLANIMSSNCDMLEFNEILEMLKAYFQNVYSNNDEVVA